MNSICRLSISSCRTSSSFKLPASVLDELTEDASSSTTTARSPRMISAWSVTPDVADRGARMCFNDEDAILSVPTPDLITSTSSRGPGWAEAVQKMELSTHEARASKTSSNFNHPRARVTRSPPIASVPTPELVVRCSDWTAAASPAHAQKRAALAASSTTTARSPRMISAWSVTPDVADRGARMCFNDEDAILSVPTPDLITSTSSRGPGWAEAVQKMELSTHEARASKTSSNFNHPRARVTRSPPIASVPTPELVVRCSDWTAAAPPAHAQKRAALAAEERAVKPLATAAARQQFVRRNRRCGGPVAASGASTYSSYSYSSSDDSSSSSSPSSSGGSERASSLRHMRQWAGRAGKHEERTARNARKCHYQDADDAILDVETPEVEWRNIGVAAAAERDTYLEHASAARAAYNGAYPPQPPPPSVLRGGLAAAATVGDGHSAAAAWQAGTGAPALDAQLQQLEASLLGELRALSAKLDATLLVAPSSTTTASAQRWPPRNEVGAVASVTEDGATDGASAAAALAREDLIVRVEASVRGEVREISAKLEALLDITRQLRPPPPPAFSGGDSGGGGVSPLPFFTNPSIHMA